MTDHILLIMLGLSVLSSIAIAGILAYKDMKGWGWFLFIAFLISTGFKITVN